MANETANTLVQKRASRSRWSCPVARQRTSSVAMKAASPIVKLGKMMWNEIVNANWMRASRRASNSMGPPPWLVEGRAFCRRSRDPSSDASARIVIVHGKRKERLAVGALFGRELRQRCGPEAHHAVGAGRRQMLPIGREGDSGRPAAMAA